MRIPVTALVVFSGLALAGCGGLDVEEAETKIRDTLQSSARGGDEITKIDCPSDVPLEKDRKDVCTGTTRKGASLKVELVQTSDDGDVRYRLVEQVVPGASLEAPVATALERSVGEKPAGVECPARVKLAPGSTVRCTVEAGDGSEIGATVTVKDVTGEFDVKVDEEVSKPPGQ